MRSLSTAGLPAELVQLTANLAMEARPMAAGPADRPWSVPLLVTPEAEAWLTTDPFAVADVADYRLLEYDPTVIAPGLEVMAQ